MNSDSGPRDTRLDQPGWRGHGGQGEGGGTYMGMTSAGHVTPGLTSLARGDTVDKGMCGLTRG